MSVSIFDNQEANELKERQRLEECKHPTIPSSSNLKNAR
ncbi:Uncharacterised protein [Moraxella osloensis]|uniref:Uncharacterized protein n=1 Tax=Faucicola osloensis TaxID=34062 RepID=A0A378QWT2_FAUOS|nr:Uncharacterised protein [Moraxella osloensis]